jgi:hypothetical protein
MKALHAGWALLYPLYQIIGTARHELSHAVTGVLQGGTLLDIRLLPMHDPVRGWFWGYARFAGPTHWTVAAAPYATAIALFALGAWICSRFRGMPAWMWMNCFILGVLSPCFDIAYNLAKVYFRGNGDVYELMRALGPIRVQAIFLGALIAMGVGIGAMIRARLSAPASAPPTSA